MVERFLNVLLVYYSAFWFINVCAYLAITFGLLRWLKFVKGMDAEGVVRVSLKVTSTFAVARLLAGSIGIGLYETDHLSAIETILTLGVTSLLLNTTFIMTEGWFINREARAVYEMPAEGQVTVKDAINKFDKLRRTANAA